MNKFKILTLCSSVALLVGTTQLAHAHAGFRDAATENVKSWNAINIGHGCNSNAIPEGTVGTRQKDVIAFSALFPNPSDTKDVVYRGSKGTVSVTGAETTLTDISAHIVSPATAIAITPLSQNNIFINTIDTFDSLNKLRGWQSWAGPSPFNGPVLLESALKFNPADGTTTTAGHAPFGLNAIAFKPESCAKTLKIRVAVADWCMSGAKNNADASRVDVWIGAKTPLFNDDNVLPNPPSKANGIYWPTLTVNRDLALNPLPGTKGFNATTGVAIDRTQPGWVVTPASGTTAAVTSTKVACTDAADYDTIYIEPTPADIDQYLPIKKDKFPKGSNGVIYWPAK